MKKIFLISLVAILALFTAACNENSTLSPTGESDNSEVLSVYTTVYPLTYFTERIGGELINVESIYPAGANEHTFDPTQKDMMALADADLFFYIGLGLEGFVNNAKKTLANENVTMVATADSVSDAELAVSEGHKEHSDEEGTEHEEEGHDANEEDTEHEEESHDAHDHGEVDPHLWISPQISIKLATSIKNSLVEKDPNNESIYTENFNTLVTELEKLDADFTAMADASNNKIFFVSHAAFGYLAGTYGLEQVAVSGLNSQDEPSQKELTELVEFAKEQNIKTILFEQNVSSNLSKVIQKEIGAEAKTIHNLGVLTKEDIDNKENYFTLMEKNLATLKEALHSSN